MRTRSLGWAPLMLVVGCVGTAGLEAPDAGGTPVDAGGGPVDAGVQPDAGAGVDAGVAEFDAGFDAGVAEFDAGVDAGVAEFDAGFDAGVAGFDAGVAEFDAGADAGIAQADAGAGDRLAVKGSKVFFNDAEFIARGLVIEGLLIPEADVEQCLADYPVDDAQHIHKYCQRHVDSRDYLYGRGVFAGGNDVLTLALKNWAINTIRFNVLQVALDPASPYFSAAYVNEIRAAVSLARSKGLVVILAIFDSPANDDPYFKGRYPKLSLDDEVTLAAAKTLAREFGRDRAVVLELLNEPYLAKTLPEVRWAIWRDGGTVASGPFAGHVFVGVNRIIADVRALGAQNAIIVQPPSATFEGYPGGVVDPLDQVIFSAHAFMVEGDDANVNWQLLFGEFAKTHPFVMTAWGVDSDSSDPKNQWCAVRGPDMAQKYLNTMQSLGAGVVGFALDVNFTIVGNFVDTFDKPTKISQSCGPGGGGELLRSLFRGQLAVLANATPVVSGVTQPGSVHANAPASFTVAATDADADPLNYRVRWGDGTTSPSATSLQTSNSFSHTYATAGSYSASVEVIDGKGASVNEPFSVVVAE